MGEHLRDFLVAERQPQVDVLVLLCSRDRTKYLPFDFDQFVLAASTVHAGVRGLSTTCSADLLLQLGAHLLLLLVRGGARPRVLPVIGRR